MRLNSCRACGSNHLMDLELRKSYYLANIDLVYEAEYAVCPQCGTVHQDCYPSDEFIRDYYASSPMLRKDNISEEEKAQYRAQVGFIDHHITNNVKVLVEYGAHTGGFLEYAREAWQCRTYYSELSVEAVSILRQKEGLIDVSKLDDSEVVDLVVMRHVLEHIEDPVSFIVKSTEQLAPNGFLYIEVPDWSKIDTETDQLCFEHLSQFTSHGLLRLVQRAGCSPIALEKAVTPEDPTTCNRVQRLLLVKDQTQAATRQDYKDRIRKELEDNSLAWISNLNKLLNNLSGYKRIGLAPASHLGFTAVLESDVKKCMDVVGFFDVDEKKHGKTYCDLDVFSHEEATTQEVEIMLICSTAYEKQIAKSLKARGFEGKIILMSDLQGSR